VARKTLADLRRSPKTVSAEELLAVLAEHGWTLRAGTRHGTIAQKGARTILVPRPHGKHVLSVYVRRAVQVIEEAE